MPTCTAFGLAIVAQPFSSLREQQLPRLSSWLQKNASVDRKSSVRGCVQASSPCPAPSQASGAPGTGRSRAKWCRAGAPSLPAASGCMPLKGTTCGPWRGPPRKRGCRRLWESWTALPLPARGHAVKGSGLNNQSIKSSSNKDFTSVSPAWPG